MSEKHIIACDTIGILLTNLGTPQAPTTRAVRRYLAEFLSDPRVVEIPRLLWWTILYGIILPFRSPRSAKLYQKIWTPEGSPLRVIVEKQARALQTQLGKPFLVLPAMRYGEPSLTQALQQFQQAKIRKILLFPLYPQYASATIASTFDAVAKIFRTFRWQPALRTITGYHDNPAYIQAVAESIKQYWQIQGKTQKLLFSFHGLPKKTLEKGDPYYCLCQKTARLIAEQLQLTPDDYQIAFQSRLGRAPWLQPYTDKVLQQWAKEGTTSVSVICPGFSADCLETLEEINQLNRKLFLEAGGKVFHYIPALNDSASHIHLLASIVQDQTQGWIKEKEGIDVIPA